MKIGASTLSGLKNKLETSLEFIEDTGIEYAEIMHQYPNEEISREITESFNLKYSIHSPIIDINIASLNTAIRRASIAEIKKSIDIANKIGAETVVVHPGNIPFLGRGFEDKIYEIANSAIKEIGDYGKDLGVTAAIENMPAIGGLMYKDVNALNELVTNLDMYMTLDIGHAYHVGYGPGEMYFDSIKHIHAHDNNGDDDSHFALGEGSIDVKSIINKFEKEKYDGIYIIEVNDEESVKKSYEYMKKI